MADDNRDQEDTNLHYEAGVVIFAPPVQDPRSADKAKEKAQRAYEDRQIRVQRGTLYTQVLLVIFGLIGTVVSVWQAKTAQQSADTAEKQTLVAQQSIREARAASSESSKQAGAALTSTIQNFRQDQRAWVGIFQATAQPVVPNQGFGFRIELTNTGKTPAFHLVHRSAFRLIPSNSEPFNPAPLVDQLKPIPSGIMFPGGKGEIAQKIDVPVTPEQASGVVSQTKIFYVYGKVTYDDVFGASHYLTFCLRLLPDGNFVASNAYNRSH